MALKRLGKLKKRLPGPLRDWFEALAAKRADKALTVRYKADLEGAKTQEGRDEVHHHYADELEVVWEPIRIRRSKRLAARARVYGIPVPPFPKAYDSDENWYFSNSCADWYLTKEATARLKSQVRKERRATSDELRKNITLIIALAALLLSIAALWMKHK